MILYGVAMTTLKEHYRVLRDLDSSWHIDDVALDLPGKQVVIRLSHSGGSLVFPDCSEGCPRADTAPERTWRHLDTMQFKTEIRAAVPRTRCEKCGVKTIAVPWAGKHSRFTLLFEALTIKVLQAASSVKKAAELLNIGWDSMHAIVERAVERGLQRRQLDNVRHVGVDEKSFGEGHDYVSIMTDLDGHRVLAVAPERTIESCDLLWKTLTETQQSEVESVSMDMWQAFMTSAEKNAQQAEIVHDRFHVCKHIKHAVDNVRRQENRDLQSEGDHRLKGTRQLWLFNQENLDEDSYYELLIAQRGDLKTGRAWAMQENFRDFWNRPSERSGKRFFDHWYS